MKSIKGTKTKQLIIKNSRFIGIITHVESEDDIEAERSRIKALYPDASHHCFAYVLGDRKLQQKYSDDKEPSQTAGVPILNVIHQHDLTDVLIIVVRYFGGTKLGAGGLVRAYTKSAVQVLELALIVHKARYTTIKVSTPFDQIGIIEQLLSTFTIQDRLYDSAVHFTITVKHSSLKSLQQQIINATKGKASFEVISKESRYE